MKFRKDEVIVLHGRRWSESSFILACLSREHGKLTVVSKGARRPKSFTGSYHIPGSHVELIWIEHAQRDLQSLVAIDPVFPVTVPVEYERYAAWMRTLKLVKRTTNAESPHPTGFYQLIRTLQALSTEHTDAQLIFLQFVLRWVSELGFPIDWSRCEQCGFPVRGAVVKLLIERGVGVCEKCISQQHTIIEEQWYQISGEAFAWLRRLESMPEHSIQRISISDRARNEMEAVCSRYTEHHLGISLHPSHGL